MAKEKEQAQPQCAVTGCGQPAVAEVILYDVYPHDGTIFFERDYTCPFICNKHLIENEAGAKGTRQNRGVVSYPHTNKHGAQGFTIYQPLEEWTRK